MPARTRGDGDVPPSGIEQSGGTASVTGDGRGGDRRTRRELLAILAALGGTVVLDGCQLASLRTPTRVAVATPPAIPTPTSEPIATAAPVVADPSPTFPPTEAPSPTAPPPAPSATPTRAPVTLTWWTGPADTLWLKAATQAANQITGAWPGVTVRVSGGHADFGNVVGGIASGQAPDALDVGTLVPLVTRGICREIETYLAASPEVQANYLPAMWSNGLWAGKAYGLPALDHGPELGLIWNVRLAGGELSEARPPTTWDDVYRAGQRLTRLDPAGAIQLLGFDPLDGVGALLDTVRDATGQEWLDGTGHHVTLANPAYQAFLETIATFYRSVGADRIAAFRQDVAPLTGPGDAGFYQGRQVVVVGEYWVAGGLTTAVHDTSTRFAAAWIPTTLAGGRVQRVGGRLLTIPSAARSPDDGWELIRRLVGDSVNDLFRAGTGRFVATRSYLKRDDLRNDPVRRFFVESLDQATRLTSRSRNLVAGYAEVKWEQCVGDVLAGGKAVPDALAAAQRAIEAELKRVGG